MGLYQWKNGIQDDKSGYILKYNICSFGKILPFKSALSMYLSNKAATLWRNSLFPFMTTNPGDFLLLDTDKKSKTFNMVFVYSPELLITTEETIYNSLESLFRTLILCFEEYAYKFDESDQTLIIDFELESKISLENNPNSTYWC